MKEGNGCRQLMGKVIANKHVICFDYLMGKGHQILSEDNTIIIGGRRETAYMSACTNQCIFYMKSGMRKSRQNLKLPPQCLQRVEAYESRVWFCPQLSKCCSFLFLRLTRRVAPTTVTESQCSGVPPIYQVTR